MGVPPTKPMGVKETSEAPLFSLPMADRYVLHVGDSVQEGGSETEWANIDKAMGLLDGKVPYIMAVGNHDYDRIKPPKSTVMFNRTFPVERFKKLPGGRSGRTEFKNVRLLAGDPAAARQAAPGAADPSP